MSAQTPNHSPGELIFRDCDDMAETVTFTARSASRPGAVNTVTLLVRERLATCDCPAALNGQSCWHTDLVATAWALHPTRAAVAGYEIEEVCAAGQSAVNHCRVYRRRRWAVPVADRLAVVACREEWRKRRSKVWTKIGQGR